MRLEYLLGAAALMIACATPDPQQDTQTATDTAGTSGAVVFNLPEQDTTKQKPLYVDVRTKEEWDAGHVKDAVLIPYDQMEQRWQELAKYKDQPVVLYCRSGRRAGIALELLKGKGFTKVENGGGLVDVEKRGVTVVK